MPIAPVLHRFARVALLAAACSAPALAADEPVGPAPMTSREIIDVLAANPPRPLALGTALPSPIALAATWDPALVREAYATAAHSLRAQGVRAVLGPSLEIARDPRRGRPEQSFGEDAYLVGELGVAAIQGLQSAADGTPLVAVATGFAGPPLPRDGAGTAPMSERELRQVFLAPYGQAIARANLAAVEPSRNEMGGVPSHASRRLLADMLRGELHFRGAVVAEPDGIADLAGVYRIAAGADDAARIARAAGVDVIASAAAAPTRIEVPDELALRAATRAVTLLKNDGALPLVAAVGTRPRIALLEAGDARAFADAIREQARDRVEVVAPADADRVVVIVGAGATDPSRRAAEQAASGKPVIAVLAGERPAAPPALADRASALVAAWALGPQGPRAVAAILLGDANPGGKLPVTLARSAGQLPLFHDAKPSSRRGYLFGPSEPLFPFGWGLSYTTFEIAPPQLSTTQVDAAGSVNVSVAVRNTGSRAGDATIELYVRQKTSSVARAVQQLAGFQRVSLAPGERRTVTLTLAMPRLALWNGAMQRVVEPGEYQVMTGPDSAHLDAVSFNVTGDAR